ncbi:MAG: hypothetical protein FJZ57_05460 [Chlamydiae bacterium]|nr:hypothetical protein [Chlamydiota bacterium]
MKKNKKYYLLALYIAFIFSFKFWHIEKIEVPYSHHSSTYVSSYGFTQSSNIKPSRIDKTLDQYLDPEKITHGAILAIEASSFPVFYKEFFPKIKAPFTLIVTSKDQAFPSESNTDIDSFLGDKKVMHVFAQNCDYCGDKVNISSIPCGLDFFPALSKKNAKLARRSPKAQEHKIDQVISLLKPINERKKRVYIDAGFHDMQAIFDELVKIALVVKQDDSMLIDDLRKKKGEYAFIVCPTEKALDAGCIWENLILGSIVIVKSSPIDKIYDGFPVVIVDDWSEINEQNLYIWYDRYAHDMESPEYRKKLTQAYWMSKISAAIDTF